MNLGKRSFLAALGLLFSTAISAQSFKPFRANSDYHYTDLAGNWVSVRISSPVVSGGDSIFSFNLVTEPVINPPGPQNCDGVILEPKYFNGSPNAFGYRMIQKPGGLFIFVQAANATNDSLFLYTQVPVNTTRPFAIGTGETATLISIGLYSVFGVTDTVKTWNISNGRKIRISHNLGIIEGHDFLGYADGGALNDLLLRSYSAAGVELGTTPPSFADIFDFDTGDKFCFKTEVTDESGNVVTEEWKWYEVIAEDLFPSINHVNYVVKADLLGLYSKAGSVTIDTQLVKGEIQNWTFARSDYPYLNAMGGEYVSLSNGSGVVLETISPAPEWNGRGRYILGANILMDTCNDYLSFPASQAWRMEFVDGLGMTRSWDPDKSNHGTWLLCYSKGTETAGSCPVLSEIVSAVKNVADPNFRIFPNPASDILQLSMDDNSSEMELRILDLSGRVMIQANIDRAMPEVNVSALIPGIYLAEISSPTGEKSVMKLIICR